MRDKENKNKRNRSSFYSEYWELSISSLQESSGGVGEHDQ